MEDPKDVFSKVCELRFTGVIFWAGTSPFLLNATLPKRIEGYEQADREFVRKVVRSLFVDDFVGGANNSNEAVVLRRGKLAEVVQKGGFTLHKWKSDSEKVRKSLIHEGKGDIEETFLRNKV